MQIHYIIITLKSNKRLLRVCNLNVCSYTKKDNIVTVEAIFLNTKYATWGINFS